MPAKRKAFNDLTDAGKAKRLKEYADKRAEQGLLMTLGNIVGGASFYDTKKEGAKPGQMALIHVACTPEGGDKRVTVPMTMFIPADKGEGRKAFLDSLSTGDLVQIEYKTNPGEDGAVYYNAWNVFLRKKAKAKNA